jgi:hypothetical protein
MDNMDAIHAISTIQTVQKYDAKSKVVNSHLTKECSVKWKFRHQQHAKKRQG